MSGFKTNLLVLFDKLVSLITKLEFLKQSSKYILANLGLKKYSSMCLLNLRLIKLEIMFFKEDSLLFFEFK